MFPPPPGCPSSSVRHTRIVTLRLHNPHSIRAALAVRPADVTRVVLPPGALAGAWRAVADAADRAGVPSHPAPAGRAPRPGDKTARESAAHAVVREHRPTAPEDLFRDPPPRGIWIALDGLTDPHNVGAVFRSAAFFGVRGLLLPRDRSAPMTSTVYDVASGGVEAVPFAIVPNLRRAFDHARAAGCWLLGAAERADTPLAAIPRDRPWLLVLGEEERGVRAGVLAACDQVCAIPARGAVTTLNVAAAAAVCLAYLAADA